jgi:hypothetical protein
VRSRFGDTASGKRIPVGKPWDRQPVSGKLRRKLGVSPGFAATGFAATGFAAAGFAAAGFAGQWTRPSQRKPTRHRRGAPMFGVGVKAV